MCWSTAASVSMVGLGAVATGVTIARGSHPAIWGAIAYFTFMEALQVAGYAVLDQCGSTTNTTITWLSYLHIVFQPLVMNAFAMELVPTPVKHRMRVWIFAACGVSSAIMLIQLIPIEAFGSCEPGSILCALEWCTRAGTWHLAWDVPYNGMLLGLGNVIGIGGGFPSYMVAAFILPLLYGAWRFALFQFLLGPVLAMQLTSDPNEVAAIWCLFSIGLALISLSPMIRRSVSTETWFGLRI